MSNYYMKGRVETGLGGRMTRGQRGTVAMLLIVLCVGTSAARASHGGSHFDQFRQRTVDLTGDGVEDLVTAVSYPRGQGGSKVIAVTANDGSTGAQLWHRTAEGYLSSMHVGQFGQPARPGVLLRYMVADLTLFPVYPQNDRMTVWDFAGTLVWERDVTTYGQVVGGNRMVFDGVQPPLAAGLASRPLVLNRVTSGISGVPVSATTVEIFDGAAGLRSAIPFAASGVNIVSSSVQVDFDGVPDLAVIATAYNPVSVTQVHRELTTLSGATGHQIWTQPLEPDLAIDAVGDLTGDGIDDYLRSFAAPPFYDRRTITLLDGRLGLPTWTRTTLDWETIGDTDQDGVGELELVSTSREEPATVTYTTVDGTGATLRETVHDGYVNLGAWTGDIDGDGILERRYIGPGDRVVIRAGNDDRLLHDGTLPTSEVFAGVSFDGSGDDGYERSVEGLGTGEPPTLRLKAYDGLTATTLWQANVASDDYSSGFEVRPFDLDGDRRSEVLVAVETPGDALQIVALSGIDGSVRWRATLPRPS